MSFTEVISKALNTELEQVKARLQELGVDGAIVDQVFSGPVKKPDPVRIQNKNVHLVRNYGRSHALFGPFDSPQFESFKKDYLIPQKWIMCKNLAYGPGWMLLNPGRINELREKLQSEKIPFEETERSDFDKKWRECQISASIPVEETNEWGNVCDSRGFVYFTIFSNKVVIGVQDEKSSLKGIDSVRPLSSKEKKICQEYGIEYLDESLVKEVEKKATTLRNLVSFSYLLKVPILDQNDDCMAEVEVQAQFPSKKVFEMYRKKDFKQLVPMLETYIVSVWEGNNKINGKIVALKRLKKTDKDCFVVV